MEDLDDYIEELKEQRYRRLKASFLEYIIALENQIELAEEYASSGDTRVLAIARSLKNIENEVVEKANDANESVPPEDYSIKIQHVVDAFKAKYPEVYAQSLGTKNN